MRASRLLHILLLLQNRGRMTAAALAREVEVAHRTVLRDMDALTEAGLPVIAFQGNQGGFELAFDYRTRLTGLDADETEALAIVLDAPTDRLAALGLVDAGRRAISKLRESFPDRVRLKLRETSERFPLEISVAEESDVRLPALAQAVRQRLKVRLAARSATPRLIHPTALAYANDEWLVTDGLSGEQIALPLWLDINVSGLKF